MRNHLIAIMLAIAAFIVVSAVAHQGVENWRNVRSSNLPV